MKTVLFLNHDHMGHADVELGRRLLGTFLRKCTSLDRLEAIAFVNSGVKLVAPDSSVLTELSQLEQHGVDLLPCGTCLDHFAIEPSIGQRSDMDAIVKELDRADKVITL